jgi:hypothetical protein
MQRYNKKMGYANKWGFFDEKMSKWYLDRMDKAMLAEIAARSRQLGVTTGIQCRENGRRKPDTIRGNGQSEPAYNAGLMNKGSRIISGTTDIEKGIASPNNGQNRNSTAGRRL